MCAHHELPHQQPIWGVQDEHEWLLVGAVEKARSITELTRGIAIKSLIDIGAGSGAVLEVLDAQGFADEYYVVEPSKPMFDYMEQRGAIRRLACSDNATLQGSKLSSQVYDLAILSHVLEHVENPAQLLLETMAIAEYTVVEVPLDGNIGGNLRDWLRRLIRKRDRRDNEAGHIQFFSETSIRDLVRHCNGMILRQRRYSPDYALSSGRSGESTVHGLLRRALTPVRAAVGSNVWARYYYGHYAILVVQRPPDTATIHRPTHPHFFYGDSCPNP